MTILIIFTYQKSKHYNMKKTSIQFILIASLSSLTLSSCGEDAPIEQNVIDTDVFDPNSSLNTIFDGKIFSIPSPVQTAYLK